MTDNKMLAKKIPLLEEFEEVKSENEDIVNDIINKYKELNEKCDVVLEKLKNKKIKPKAAASRTLAKSK